MPYSRNAFNCHKCPQKAGDGGCPMWWETVRQNDKGEVDVVRSCGFEQLPTYLIEVIKASNRPAAAIESTRNEIAYGLHAVSKAISEGLPALANKTSDLKSIENGITKEDPDD